MPDQKHTAQHGEPKQALSTPPCSACSGLGGNGGDDVCSRCEGSGEEVADCPNCDNVGWYMVPDSNGEPTPEQCQWCHTVPNSRFNSLPNTKHTDASR